MDPLLLSRTQARKIQRWKRAVGAGFEVAACMLPHCLSLYRDDHDEADHGLERLHDSGTLDANIEFGGNSDHCLLATDGDLDYDIQSVSQVSHG